MSVHQHRRGRAVLLGASFVALAAAVVGGLKAASASDDHGDTPATATAIPLGTQVPGTIGMFGDQDWFVVAATPGQPLVVSVSWGTMFLPRVTVYDGNLAPIASGPQRGPMVAGNVSFPVPEGTSPPIRVLVTGQLGSGQYTVQVSSAGPTPPPPPLPPVELPPPPPPPAAPTDDVPQGQIRAISSTGIVDGRLEVAGDSDSFSYEVPVDGDYTFALTSPDASLHDAAADVNAQMGLLGSWFSQPVPLTLTAGTGIRIMVHSLGDNVGNYRITIVAPAGAVPPPVDPNDPPADPNDPPADPTPPPPVRPVFTGLSMDVVQDMLANESRFYGPYLGKYRIRDTVSVGNSLAGALAIRDRWIRRNRGEPKATAFADSTGAIDGALSRFGTGRALSKGFANFTTLMRAGTVPGGGDRARLLALVDAAIAANRPMLLSGRRADGLVQVWVVYGKVTIGDVTTLRALDPLQLGATLPLPMGDAGILPVGEGSALITRFFLTGADKDALP